MVCTRVKILGSGRLPWVALVGGVAFWCGLMASSGRASMRVETLKAINSVENPRNTLRPGKYGELGPYQFRAGTWRMHTAKPFHRATDPKLSEEVAIRHYEWLRRGLIRNEVEPTPYNIALAWNAGLTAVVRRKASRSAHDYAQRVSNLVQDFTMVRVAAAQ